MTVSYSSVCEFAMSRFETPWLGVCISLPLCFVVVSTLLCITLYRYKLFDRSISLLLPLLKFYSSSFYNTISTAIGRKTKNSFIFVKIFLHASARFGRKIYKNIKIASAYIGRKTYKNFKISSAVFGQNLYKNLYIAIFYTVTISARIGRKIYKIIKINSVYTCYDCARRCLRSASRSRGNVVSLTRLSATAKTKVSLIVFTLLLASVGASCQTPSSDSTTCSAESQPSSAFISYTPSTVLNTVVSWFRPFHSNNHEDTCPLDPGDSRLTVFTSKSTQDCSRESAPVPIYQRVVRWCATLWSVLKGFTLPKPHNRVCERDSFKLYIERLLYGAAKLTRVAAFPFCEAKSVTLPLLDRLAVWLSSTVSDLGRWFVSWLPSLKYSASNVFNRWFRTANRTVHTLGWVGLNATRWVASWEPALMNGTLTLAGYARNATLTVGLFAEQSYEKLSRLVDTLDALEYERSTTAYVDRFNYAAAVCSRLASGIPRWCLIPWYALRLILDTVFVVAVTIFTSTRYILETADVSAPPADVKLEKFNVFDTPRIVYDSFAGVVANFLETRVILVGAALILTLGLLLATFYKRVLFTTAQLDYIRRARPHDDRPDSASSGVLALAAHTVREHVYPRFHRFLTAYRSADDAILPPNAYPALTSDHNAATTGALCPDLSCNPSRGRSPTLSSARRRSDGLGADAPDQRDDTVALSRLVTDIPVKRALSSDDIYIANQRETRSCPPLCWSLVPRTVRPFNSASAGSVKLISSANDFIAFLAELLNCSCVALDVEAYTYKGRIQAVCLLQVVANDQAILVDTLAVADVMNRLNDVTANAHIVKVMHGTTNDLWWLERDYGLRFRSLIDTSLLAQHCGVASTSLTTLLKNLYDVEQPNAKRADWRVRPLTDTMLQYAVEDVSYLIPLARKYIDLIQPADIHKYKEAVSRMTYKSTFREYNTACCQRSRPVQTRPAEHVDFYDLVTIRHECARDTHVPCCGYLADATLLTLAAELTSRMSAERIAGITGLSTDDAFCTAVADSLRSASVTRLPPGCLVGGGRQQSAKPDEAKSSSRSTGGAELKWPHPHTVSLDTQVSDLRKVHISNMLTDEEQRVIQTTFPELNFTFGSTSGNPHALGNALDIAMQAYGTLLCRSSTYLKLSTRVDAKSNAALHVVDARTDAAQHRTARYLLPQLKLARHGVNTVGIERFRFAVNANRNLRSKTERLRSVLTKYPYETLAKVVDEATRMEELTYETLLVVHPSGGPAEILSLAQKFGCSEIYVIMHTAPILCYSADGYDDIFAMHLSRDSQYCRGWFADGTTGYSRLWSVEKEWTKLPPNVWYGNILYYAEITRAVSSLTMYHLTYAPSGVETPDFRSMFPYDGTLVVGPKLSLDPYRTVQSAVHFDTTRLTKLFISFLARPTTTREATATKIGASMSRIMSGASAVVDESIIPRSSPEIVSFLINAFDAIPQSDSHTGSILVRNAVGDSISRPSENFSRRINALFARYLTASILAYLLFLSIDTIVPQADCTVATAGFGEVLADTILSTIEVCAKTMQVLYRAALHQDTTIVHRPLYQAIQKYAQGVISPRFPTDVCLTTTVVLLLLTYSQPNRSNVRLTACVVSSALTVISLGSAPSGCQCPNLMMFATVFAIVVSITIDLDEAISLFLLDRRPLRHFFNEWFLRVETMILILAAIVDAVGQDFYHRLFTLLCLGFALAWCFSSSRFYEMLERKRLDTIEDWDVHDHNACHYRFLPLSKLTVSGSAKYGSTNTATAERVSVALSPAEIDSIIYNVVLGCLKHDLPDEVATYVVRDICKTLEIDVDEVDSHRVLSVGRGNVYSFHLSNAYESMTQTCIQTIIRRIRQFRVTGRIRSAPDPQRMQRKLVAMLSQLRPDGALDVLELGTAPGHFQIILEGKCIRGEPNCTLHGSLHALHYTDGNVKLDERVRPRFQARTYKDIPPSGYKYWLSDIALDGTAQAENQFSLNQPVYDALLRHFDNDDTARRMVIKMFADDENLLAMPFYTLTESMHANNEVYVVFDKSEELTTQEYRCARLLNSLTGIQERFRAAYPKNVDLPDQLISDPAPARCANSTGAADRLASPRRSQQPTARTRPDVNAADRTPTTPPGAASAPEPVPEPEPWHALFDACLSLDDDGIEAFKLRVAQVDIGRWRNYKKKRVKPDGDCLFNALNESYPIEDRFTFKCRLLELDQRLNLLDCADSLALGNNAAGFRDECAWLSNALLQLIANVLDVTVIIVDETATPRQQIVYNAGRPHVCGFVYTTDHYDAATFVMDIETDEGPEVRTETSSATDVGSTPARRHPSPTDVFAAGETTYGFTTASSWTRRLKGATSSDRRSLIARYHVAIEIDKLLQRCYASCRPVISQSPLDRDYLIFVPHIFRTKVVAPPIVWHQAPFAGCHAVTDFCTGLAAQLYSQVSYVAGEMSNNRDAATNISCDIDETDDIVICRYGGDRNKFKVMTGAIALEKKKKLSMTKKQFMTSSELRYCHSYRQLMGLLARPYEPMRILFSRILRVNGIAGCGKTHMIKRLLESTYGSKLNIKVLCVTHNNTKDLEFAKAVTITSFLASYKTREPVDLLVIDEATMLHAGLVLLVGALTNATDVLLVGDDKQIPSINRDPLYKSDPPPLHTLPNVCVQVNNTFRMPLDAACVASTRYGCSITTHNLCKDSIRTIVTGNVMQVLKTTLNESSNKRLILTFTQEEKEALIQAGHPALTVHEAEGATCDEVYLVRQTTKDYPIFASERNLATNCDMLNAHQLVAITRHTKKFVYITALRDDLVNLISRNLHDGADYQPPYDSDTIIDFLLFHVPPKRDTGRLVTNERLVKPTRPAYPSVDTVKRDAQIVVDHTHDPDAVGVVDDRKFDGVEWTDVTSHWKPHRTKTKITIGALNDADVPDDPPAASSARTNPVRRLTMAFSQPRLSKLHPVRYVGGTERGADYGCWYSVIAPLFQGIGWATLSKSARMLNVPIHARVNFNDVLENLAVMLDVPMVRRNQCQNRAGLYAEVAIDCRVTDRCDRYSIYYDDTHVSNEPFANSYGSYAICHHPRLRATDVFVGTQRRDTTLNVISPHDFATLGNTSVQRKSNTDSINIVNQFDIEPVQATEHALVDRVLFTGIDYIVDEGPLHNACDTLQEAYDEALPGVSAIDYSLDDEVNMFEDVFTPSSHFAIDYTRYLDNKPSAPPIVTPKLQTGIPNRRPNCGRVLLTAVGKRNFLVGKTMPNCAARDFAVANFETFARTYFRENAFSMLKEYESQPIVNDAVLTAEWFDRLDGAKRQGLIKDFVERDLLFIDFSRYESHLKPDPKAAADGKIMNGLPKGQVINAMDRRATAVYSPIMREAMRRLRTLLKENFVLAVGYSPAALNAHANHFASATADDDSMLEVDFSSFDKNAQQPHLEAFLYLMLRLGVPKRYVDLWRECHERSFSFSRVGVSFRKAYQTQSGDASTTLVNTYTNMYACADLAANAKFGYFAGDDSLLVGAFNKRNIAKYERAVAFNYNLVAKLILSKGYGYFCGAYLVCAGSWRFMTDPIKRIERLGRRDLNDFDKLASQWISYSDLLSCFGSTVHNLALAEALSCRLGVKYDFYYACCALFHVSRSLENFLSVYDVPEHVDVGHLAKRVAILRDRAYEPYIGDDVEDAEIF